MKKFKEWCKKEKIFITIILLVIITRLLILAIAYFSSIKIEFLQPFYGNFLDLFHRYDAPYYIKIAVEGYEFSLEKFSSINFFPFYPILIKIFNLLIGNLIGGPKIIGYLISNISLVIASIYLYKLIRLDFNEDISMKSVFYMLIFPTSFYFSIIYTEGLFLLLTISAFYYARKKQWLVASILGFFISLTRVMGVFIFIPFLIEYLDLNFNSLKISLKKIKKDILYLLLIPAGLFSFMLYQYIKFKDPLAFYHAKSILKINYSSFAETILSVGKYQLFNRIMFLGFLIFAIIIIIYLYFSEVRLSYIIYSFVLLFVYLSTGKIEAMHRYVAVLFPIYIGMALSSKNKIIEYIYLLTLISLLTFFVILFVNRYSFF
jgi:Gpi18-like mannosyltransferase